MCKVVNMGFSFNEPSPSVGYQLDTPFSVSVYMLDACRRGTLFEPDTYRIDRITDWISQWLRGITRDISLPAGFEKAEVQRIFMDRITNNLRESDLAEMFKSVDVKNVKSVKDFIRENRERGKERLAKLEEFLRRDEFPAFLWMEFCRFHRIFGETSEFMEETVDKITRFKPKRSSQIFARNRQARWMMSTYRELVRSYFGAVLQYYRLSVFLEVWSCKEKSELFTEKCLWTFRNIRQDLFEPIFLEFHDSIGELRQSFFRFVPQETHTDFSKPIDWAFKQLILMTQNES